MRKSEERTPLLHSTPFQEDDTSLLRSQSSGAQAVLGQGQIGNRGISSHPCWGPAELPIDSDGSQTDGSVRPETPFAMETSLSQDIWSVIRNGAETSELIGMFPNKVIASIRQHGVRKLGSMEIEDRIVKHSFGKMGMVFKACETAADPNWETHWRSALEASAGKVVDKRPQGWKEDIAVSAYVVLIKNAAGDLNTGLLHPLLLKYSSGTVPLAVFGLPAVQAVINFKWVQWAELYVLVEFILYLSWLGFYTVFICLFQHPYPYKRITAVCNVMSLVFMIPFVTFDMLQLFVYGWSWFHVWNIIDLATYTIQVICTVGYMASSEGYGEFDIVDWPSRNWFSVALAAQCVLLFTKAQYFSRVFTTVKSALVDILKVVMWDVRYFIFFVLMTMLSFALAFNALFRLENERAAEDPERDANREFLNLPFSFSSMFSFMLGGFDTDVFYESDLPLPSTVLFIIYEFILAVTLLNLLIAVMSDSYSKVMAKEELLSYASRAQVIDELESTLPQWMTRKGRCKFIQFAVAKFGNDPKLPEATSREPVSELEFRMSTNSLKKKIDDMAVQIQELQCMQRGLNRMKRTISK